MNVYDSELVETILKNEAFSIVQDELDADIVMLNTCSVRDNANRKIYNRVHEIKRRRPENPALVGILGCMATNFKTDLLEQKNLKIDFIAGPDSYKQLPVILHDVMNTGEKAYDVTLSEFETYSDIYPTRKEGVNAWIAVMRGCNNFCTFCVVPYTRGRERSRTVESVVQEVQKLANDGFTQVTLLGQNVNSYFSDGDDFADLMKAVSDVPGIKRILFTSPHPKDFPKKLLTLMAERDNICNLIHMPLQAGNSRVLRKMNRTYTKEEFITLVEDVRATIPNVILTTDIIVGFPTETEAEFQDTVDVVTQVQFDSAFIFKYSERPNTVAEKRIPDDIPEDVKTDRIVRLQALQKSISLAKNQAHIGQIHDVLIEKETTKKDPDHFSGRNDGNKIVILPKGPYKTGDYIQVKITDASANVLKGVPIQ